MTSQSYRKALAAGPTKIFISHNSADAAFAKKIKTELEKIPLDDGDPSGARRIFIWAFEEELEHGAKLEIISEEIMECDVFLILLSDNAVKSKWVQMELGLALKTQESNKIQYPLIVPVFANKKAPKAMLYREFGKENSPANAYEFEEVRIFSPTSITDSYETFAASISIKLRVFGANSESPEEIHKNAEECYTELFPLIEERDEWTDILAWVKKSWMWDSEAPWAELLFTIELGNVCMGMAFLSLHRPTNWIFGNYFGIRQRYREDKLTEWFLQNMIEYCIEVMPASNGIFFEVERYDESKIDLVFNKLSGKETDLTLDEKENVFAMRRVNLYTQAGLGRKGGKKRTALIATTDGHRLFSYIQPAMQPPFHIGSTNEVPLWLMLYPFEKLGVKWSFDKTVHEVKLNDVLNFIYDNLFGDAYARDGITSREGVDQYLKDLKEKIRSDAEADTIIFSDIGILSGRARKLIHQHKRHLRRF